jgi:hypothetical protein
MEQQYTQTGKNIPVNFEELSTHIEKVLYNYEIRSNRDSNYNPFTDPIIYTTNDGKTIQIPDSIQQKVVNEWNNKKNVKGHDIQPHSDVNFNESDLGLHSDDNKYRSSVRPFGRFDSLNMPDSSHILNERTFASSNIPHTQTPSHIQSNMQSNIHSQVQPQIQPLSVQVPHNVTTSMLIPSTIKKHIIPSEYTNSIVEKEIKNSDNNIYYIILLILIVLGGMYVLKNNK